MTEPHVLAMFEPEPTPGEKALYDKFVSEYIRDYNAFLACTRIGFQQVYAAHYAESLLQKPYVNRRIAEHKATMPSDEKSQEAADKALVLAGARELAQNGKGSQRVAALALLARIRGMDVQPDKSGDALKQLADDFRELSKELPD